MKLTERQVVENIQEVHCDGGSRFTARRDREGFICAIDCDGVTILHLQAGTERNETCAELVVKALASLDPTQIEVILQAVGAYRFLVSLKTP